jgi:hypothetical protein
VTEKALEKEKKSTVGHISCYWHLKPTPTFNEIFLFIPKKPTPTWVLTCATTISITSNICSIPLLEIGYHPSHSYPASKRGLTHFYSRLLPADANNYPEITSIKNQKNIKAHNYL